MSIENDEATMTRPRKTKRTLLVSGLGLATAALVAGIIVLVQPPASEADGPTPLNVEQTQVTRGDLIEIVRVQGNLGHGSSRDMGTTLEGIVTSTRGTGTLVSVGEELFRIDDKPVVLMRGKLPAWRAFSEGMSNGNDILQLEKSLASLGFFKLTPDTKFTPVTKTAIKYWQKSVGLKQDGVIEQGRIIFSSNDVRIQGVKAKSGSAASGEIISVTGVSKEVGVKLDTSARSLAKKGAKVNVSLPGGNNEPGTISSVGTPVDEEGGGAKIPVTVVLDKPEAAADQQETPVGVEFKQTKAKNVIQVPVSALLAQPGGGFAVEVSEGETITLVPLKTGVFANGLVEVLESDLKAGDTVVVAK